MEFFHADAEWQHGNRAISDHPWFMTVRRGRAGLLESKRMTARVHLENGHQPSTREPMETRANGVLFGALPEEVNP